MQQLQHTWRPPARKRGAAGALGLVRSSEYLPPELMPSLAACIGADIAVLTPHPGDMATGNICTSTTLLYLATPAEGTGALVQMPQHWQQPAG
jgi:hypothetical protein